MLDQVRQDFSILNMQQAILQHEDFDRFIIDEADECITYRGVLIDERYQKVLGYWDLMMKRCYLFTATVPNYLEDIMFKLFGIKPEQYKKYRALMSDSS